MNKIWIFSILLLVLPICYSLDVSLGVGWNLISIPLQLSDNGISPVLSSINNNYSKVAYYNSTSGKYQIYAPNSFQNLYELNQGMGFWIKMNQSDTLEVSGSYSATTLNLKAGWNMIGYPLENNMSTYDFANITDAQVVLKYNGSTYVSYIRNRFNNSLTAISKGFGYWVKMLADKTVTLGSNTPIVESVSITPDELSNIGVQISPTANGIKTVYVYAIVSHGDGVDSIHNVSMNTSKGIYLLTKISDINANTANFSGSIGMNYSDLPNNYTITVTAYDVNGTKSEKTSSFEYLSLIALAFDSSIVNFSNVNPDETAYVMGDYNLLTNNNATVKNVGNVAIDIEMSGSNLVGPDTITVNNVGYRFKGIEYNVLPATATKHNLNLTINEIVKLDFKLNVPQVRPGSYTGNISITAVGDS